MGTDRNLTGAHWRKSSYSGDNGGECIECAPLGNAAWRKSSYSGDNGGQCVEVADLAAHVAVRDSKNPGGPAFLAAPAAFAAFVSAAAEGRLGR
ncbi:MULTISPECIES: DUF397 domain-containing protein [unclassified Streptomyces]|uniref:DUF397 domain-containing protein n=1 Tax=unclassified Streptomyces TaxID=2593676 RepID=UPI0006AEBF18|nr:MULTISPECIES: DUF397 domain-containing protein [unclassified Streptomyces]KOX32449.1 toxin [Streptomyces sp. NRRL F-6491]KOX48442.1 toxin [Streptomyces sp. NRRL F-6492]